MRRGHLQLNLPHDDDSGNIGNGSVLDLGLYMAASSAAAAAGEG